MFSANSCLRLVLLFVLAISNASRSVQYSTYIGKISWNWDDSTGSGNGDLEEPLTTREDGTGQAALWSSGPSSFVAYDYERPLPPPKRGKTCNLDQNCDKNQFCHEHYKYCQKKKYPGEMCRRIENCDIGLICMWGRCRKGNKPGMRESRCKRHVDCNEGLCCARHHGESICKPYLKEGENCTVSIGGYWYAIEHDCSCGFGLICKRYGWIHKRAHSQPLMRCAKQNA